MDSNDFWTTVRDRPDSSGEKPVRTGALRAALLFGTVAIAVATIVAPMLASHSDRQVAYRNVGYDPVTTGSITPAARDRIYTVRRSVTQPMPDALCIIDGAGHRTGAC